MKLGMFLMLAALIGALVVGPMYMTGPTGKPVMTADDWVPEALEQPTNLTGEVPSGVYSWTDEEGVVHFSDTRPKHLADDEVRSLEVVSTMTLPSEAFTGPESEATADDSIPEPLRVLLKHKNGGNAGSTSESETDVPMGMEGQAAMQGALAEIEQRFPQFKAMSDQLAQRMGQSPSP